MDIDLELTTEADFDYFQKWFNDEDLMKWFPTPFRQKNYNIAFHKFWINRSDNLIYTMKDKGKPVGYIGAEEMDKLCHTCSIMVFIADREYHNKGFGAKVSNRFVEMLLFEHDIHSIQVWAVEENVASRRMIRRNGFREVGIFHESHWMDGGFKNRVLYELVKKDFVKL